MMRSSAASALRICFIALAIGVGSTAVFAAPSSDQNAEEARWVVHENTWGYMSTLDSDTHQPTAQVASFSDGALNASTGRLFFYLMTGDPVSGPGRRTTSGDDNIKSFAAALTLSEAATDPTRYNSGGSHCGARLNIDPEDPRCAKLTLSGQVAPVSSGADIAAGKAALFARHPQMAGWYSPWQLKRSWGSSDPTGRKSLDIPGLLLEYYHHPPAAWSPNSPVTNQRSCPSARAPHAQAW